MTEGWQDRCNRFFFGGGDGDVVRHPRDISKTAGICCDTVCAALCSKTAVRCATKPAIEKKGQEIGRCCQKNKNKNNNKIIIIIISSSLGGR